MSHDMYGPKVADASALIRQVSGKEYFEAFGVSSEGILELFIECMDQVREIERESIGAANGWQPIETAPKNGANVILFFPNLYNGVVTIGNWTEDNYAKKPRPYWTHDGERALGTLETRANPPTHWRPLPTPPEQSKQEGGKP